jgi:hypothetical protein
LQPAQGNLPVCLLQSLGGKQEDPQARSADVIQLRKLEKSLWAASESITVKILFSKAFAVVASSFPDNANMTASAFLSSLMSMI